MSVVLFPENYQIATKPMISPPFAHISSVSFSACSYFEVEGGGGHFPDRPSPPNGRAAARLLSSHGFTAAAQLAGTRHVLKGIEVLKEIAR